MITEELLSYIKKQLEAGHSQITIRKILIDHKWKAEDVDQAFLVVLDNHPQNTQKEVASIARPDFANSQIKSQNTTNYNNFTEVLDTKPKTDFYQTTQIKPQQQIQEQFQVKEPSFQKEGDTQNLVFRPKILINKAPIESLNKVENGLFKSGYKENESEIGKEDFYNSLIQNVSSVQEKEGQKNNFKKQEESILKSNFLENKESYSAEPRIISENIVGEFSKPAIGFEGRQIGRSFLKPKTFNPTNQNLQKGIEGIKEVQFSRFASPQVEENIPILKNKVNENLGATTLQNYGSSKEEIQTIQEAQAKSPTKFADQTNPNISIMETKSSSFGFGNFIKRLIFIILIVGVLGGGIWFYFNFFASGIKHDSKFMQNFQNVSYADFEIDVSGPILSFLSQTGDPNLFNMKIKAYVDVADNSNRISSYDFSANTNQEIIWSVISSSTSSFVYTKMEESSMKDKWFQLNGSFAQSFLPAILSGAVSQEINIQESNILNDSSLQKIRQLWGQFSFIKLVFEKEKGEIREMPVRAYSFVFEKESFKSYLDEVLVLAKGSIGFENSILKLKSILNILDPKEGIVWIGKDGLPYRVLFSVDTSGSVGTSQIKIEINSYNKRKNISLPDSFIKQQNVSSMSGLNEEKTKNLIRKILNELQMISENFKIKSQGSFVGLCQNIEIGFFEKFKELEASSPSAIPICKDSASGFVVGAQYAEGKYLCADKSKISENDSSSMSLAINSCPISKEAQEKDLYVKENFLAFVNLALNFKKENQGSFVGFCNSSTFMIFSRGLNSAVERNPSCLSGPVGFAVFTQLSDGNFACVDASAKYNISTTPITNINCK